MHRLTATDTPMVRYTRTIFPSYAELIEELKKQDFNVVAVSKTRTKEEIDEVAQMGLTTFGENRVQEFIDKYDPKYTWHIIGHLQTNKVNIMMKKRINLMIN